MIGTLIFRNAVFSFFLLLLWSCATGTPTPAKTAKQSIARSKNLDSVQQLCLRGRSIERLTRAQCSQLQQAERRTNNPLSKVLNRATIEHSVKELELGLLEGIVIGAGYKYRIEPSYRDNYFTRIDSYRFTGGAKSGDYLGRVPINIGFDRGAELLFAQQFASGPVARSPLSAYTPEMIPLTAAQALRLKVGDYVRFNARMALVANASQVWPLAGFILQGSAKFSLLVDGEFQVHLFRLDEQRVRIKLIAERARQSELSVGTKLSPLVKLALLQRAPKKILPLSKLVELDASVALAARKSDTDLFLVDYTLDLAQKNVAEAYNEILNGTTPSANLEAANLLPRETKLHSELLGNVERLDTLARHGLTENDPAVRRHFKGANYTTTRDTNFKMKLSSFEINRSRVFRDNFLTKSDFNPDGSEALSHYLLPAWSHIRERSMLFGMLDENQVRTADALFISDPNGIPTRFLNIGFGFDYKDARLRPSEYRRMRRKIELLLPQDAEKQLQESMQDSGWLEGRFRRNVSMSLRYFFHESAFDGLVTNGYGDTQRLRDALAKFIVNTIEEGEYPFHQGDLESLIKVYTEVTPAEQPEQLRAQSRSVSSQVWKRSIDIVANHLTEAFTASREPKRRMQAILSLRNNSFYRQVGTAFWAYLIAAAGIDLDAAMYLELQLSADDHESIRFTFGETNERELYDTVTFIQRLLNDRSLDMRELGDLESVISKMTVVTI